MNPDAYNQGLHQLPLLNLDESQNSIELYPAVWSALENLIGSNQHERLHALITLQEMKAARFSPLVAYILTTFLSDPDPQLRKNIIQAIGQILSPDEAGYPASSEVRAVLLRYLSRLRTRQIYSILQILADDQTLVTETEKIFNACPFAGNHLVEILNDPKVPLEIRKQSALMIGIVGFSDALAALEQIERRLEARINGQRSMPFLPVASTGEEELLPVVQQVIAILRSP